MSAAAAGPFVSAHQRLLPGGGGWLPEEGKARRLGGGDIPPPLQESRAGYLHMQVTGARQGIIKIHKCVPTFKYGGFYTLGNE